MGIQFINCESKFTNMNNTIENDILINYVYIGCRTFDECLKCEDPMAQVIGMLVEHIDLLHHPCKYK